MQRTRTGRLAIAGSFVALAFGALTLSSAGATGGPPLAHGRGITVRVEGPSSTLVATAAVRPAAGSFSKDGVAADSCSAASAAGALERATHGRWKGTWSKSLKGYFVSAIDGVSFPSTSGRYWAFWVDNAPASQGICGVVPKAGQRILFFADCFGRKCPPNGGVLGIVAPAIADAGTPFTVMVTDYADANGKARPASGAIVSGGGASATTGAGGSATLTVARGGPVTLRVRAPHAIRAEAGVCVLSSAVMSCG
jgi:Domain of unknown function (DUF4430)